MLPRQLRACPITLAPAAHRSRPSKSLVESCYVSTQTAIVFFAGGLLVILVAIAVHALRMPAGTGG
jgi:hypothetical protein